MTTAPDIPLQITSVNASSERRVTPSWTIAKLKSKLEPITGIPTSAQRLHLRSGSRLQPRDGGDGRGSAISRGGGEITAASGSHDRDSSVVIESGPGEDEENITLDRWRLVKGMEIYVRFSLPFVLRLSSSIHPHS